MPQLSEYYNQTLTLPDILRRAASDSQNSVIGFLNDSGDDTITYSQLLKEATIVAIGLVNEGIKKGDKVIIATDNNRESMIMLWGCFLCGAIPTVLQPPPTFSGYNPPVVKMLKVYEQLEQPLVFMSIIPAGADVPEMRFITTGSLNTHGTLALVPIDANDLAFIQFSSGSTGDPKGIMLTHYNIMVNLDAINVGLAIKPGDVIGNWMPLFHDMGLVGYHLAAIYTSLEQWHIETIDFIKNPGLWLNMLSDKKVKVTGCPNFGLSLTLRYLKRLKVKGNWDFSSVEAMLNGAEPISVQIMKDFISELSPYNFSPEAMMPVYGLAEVTLAATFTPIMQPTVVTAFDAVSLDRDHTAKEVQAGNENTTELVRLITSVGVPLNDIEIMITDRDFNPLPENNAGLICIKGDSVTTGYYNKPEDTQQSFHEGWFNTGDIGFLHKGNYYISGRFKDIIFKNGRHYFANDLEELACNVEGVSYGKVCFAGITNNFNAEEEVVAFIAGSVGEKAQELYKELRNLLRSKLGITLDKLIMVRSNEIPKTSSGKLQRYKLISRYISGDFSGSIISS